MQDLKPNSHKYKEEQKLKEREKKLDKAVSGTVKTKKNDMRKFTDVFISEDVKNVKSYVLMDVLVPTIKKAIVDIVTDGVNMIFFGGTGAKKSGYGASKVSYRNYYDQGRNDRYDNNPGPRTRYSYDDVILETRADAEEVLERMVEAIEVYDMVSVADLYDLVGISGDFTDQKYGWTNLSNAEPIRVGSGWMLKLPRALPLK